MKTNQKGSTIIIAIIVVILVISGFVYFNKKSQSNIINSNTSTETEKNSIPPVSNAPVIADKASLGIVVTSIRPNDIVKLPITVEGYLDGKGWYASEGEIGSVEVFDANGKSISNKEVVLTTSDWMKYPTYFKVLVGDRQMMSYIKTDTGTVKITANGAKDGEQLKSISIPVRFK